LREPFLFKDFLLYFVDVLFNILIFAIIGRALLSWFPMGPSNPFRPLAVILHQITEPVLAPLRRIIPMIGMFDISPIVALFLLQFIQRILLNAIMAAGPGGF